MVMGQWIREVKGKGGFTAIDIDMRNRVMKHGGFTTITLAVD